MTRQPMYHFGVWNIQKQRAMILAPRLRKGGNHCEREIAGKIVAFLNTMLDEDRYCVCETMKSGKIKVHHDDIGQSQNTL